MYKQVNYSFKITFVFLAPRNNHISLMEEKGIKIFFMLFIPNTLWSSLTLQRRSRKFCHLCTLSSPGPNSRNGFTREETIPNPHFSSLLISKLLWNYSWLPQLVGMTRYLDLISSFQVATKEFSTPFFIYLCVTKLTLTMSLICSLIALSFPSFGLVKHHCKSPLPGPIPSSLLFVPLLIPLEKGIELCITH